MYQIDGRDVLFAWLGKETDSVKRQLMLDWLVEFAAAPLEGATRLPGVRAPIYLVATAVPGVTVTFLHAEQFKVVKLIEFGVLP